jgi:uncharacterized protein YcgI (DUF1989 family)
MPIIPPQSGTSFLLKAGQLLKVTCPEGEQVSDLVAYNPKDYGEFISNGKTLDYEETIYLGKGNTIYSNKSNKMLEILEDTCGVHDFLLAPCCSNTFKLIYGFNGEHPSCRGNLYARLKSYVPSEESIPTAFNIFMNVKVSPEGRIKVLPPTVKPGDYILFKTHMDLRIGLTACSAEQSNNFSFKSIGYEVLPA